MNKRVLTFKADGQQLIKTSGMDEIASGTKGYLTAEFDLQGIWSSLDNVFAIWERDGQIVPTELDAEGRCSVPDELLQKRGHVKVNLAQSVVENNVVKWRLTSYPITAINIAVEVPV